MPRTNGGIIGKRNISSFGKNTQTTRTSSTPSAVTTQPGTRLVKALVIAGGAGGGGGGGSPPGAVGGAGGSGIVVVRVPSEFTLAGTPCSAFTGSTHPDGDKIGKFTSSGTLTIGGA